MFEETLYSPTDLYWLGDDTKRGGRYLGVPVSSSAVDYIEFYSISEQQYCDFLADRGAARCFADRCRRHELDDLLILQPGWNRGTPYLPDGFDS